MFTGLIEEIGVIKNVIPSKDGRTITVSCRTILDGTVIGDSIAINGACQTVTSIDKERFSVYASGETCTVSTLGMMSPGAAVNLERAMSAQSRFGGHMVQGHVDAKGAVASISRDSRGIGVSVRIEPYYMKYIVAKGSIAVDGISLTVVAVNGDTFNLYCIPETLSRTIIEQWKVGTAVNVEVDILAKYVEKMLEYKTDDTGGSDDEAIKRKLAEEGFM